MEVGGQSDKQADPCWAGSSCRQRRTISSKWGSRSQVQRVLAPVRGALSGLPGVKENKIPEITPCLCLHGKEHVGSIEQDDFFFFLILSLFVCRMGLILCLSVRVK